MRSLAHKLRVIGLLIGFYLLSIGLLAVMIVIDVLVTEGMLHAAALAKLAFICYLATFAALLIVIRGVFVSTRMRRPPGIAVTPAQEPRLWARVTQLANIVGTRPPKEIRLVPAVNAAVWEDTKLLGLVPGKRHMMIGVPLMLGLTSAQLDAVLAHELGHFSGSHTRSGALDARVRASVASAAVAAQGRRRKPGKARTFRLPGNDLFANLFTAYARLVMTVTNEESRKQEYAADRVAAQIGGRDATASALREMPVLDTAYDFYIDRYVAAGVELNLLPQPADVLGGFAALLREPHRQRELDDIREKLPSPPASKFDSHPPLPERIAAIEALPPDGRPVGDVNDRGMALLNNPAAALAAVGVKMLEPLSSGRAGVDWDQLTSAVARQRANTLASPLPQVTTTLVGRPARVVNMLDLIDAGRIDALLDSLPKPDAVVKGDVTGRRAVRELLKTDLQSRARAWILLELAAVGRVTWRHSWSEVAGEVVMAPELKADLDEAMEALVGLTPDTRPLRTVAVRAGVIAGAGVTGRAGVAV